MITSRMSNLKQLNSQKKYTKKQLLTLKKFEGKYLDVYMHHYDYWVDGKGYETVYEVRAMTKEIRENYQSVDEILSGS